MQKKTQTKSSKKRKLNSADKTLYREKAFIKRVSRYTDGQVSRIREVATYNNLPYEFFPRAAGIPVCKVQVDWLGMKDVLAEVVMDLFRSPGKEAKISSQKLQILKHRVPLKAISHVLEFLPYAFDLMLARLCHEAVYLNSGVNKKILRAYAEIFRRADYWQMATRLGIQEGPVPHFEHRSQYERALLAAIKEIVRDGGAITQENVGAKLSIDARIIRRLNKQFGVRWNQAKAFEPDKS